MSTRPTRILVVGATPPGRTRLVRSFDGSTGFEFVGETRLGSEAVDTARMSAPDLVLLDAVDHRRARSVAEAIMAERPTPILAIAPAESYEAARSELLEVGVVEVVPDRGAPGAAEIVRAARLVARIPVVTRRHTRVVPRSPVPPAIEPHVGVSGLRGIVAVGASTGGPSAVSEFLKHLPRTLPVPVLIVIHIGQSFGHSLADWLDLGSGIPVHQAADGMAVQNGHAYVCPPERHLVLVGEHLALTMSPERHSCRPSVDILFESVAEQIGSRAIGCLMTGIGRDGAAGLLEMRRRGAFTLAQDENSCAVFGMPREAIAIGAASTIAPPSRMAAIVSAQANRLAPAVPVPVAARN